MGRPGVVADIGMGCCAALLVYLSVGGISGLLAATGLVALEPEASVPSVSVTIGIGLGMLAFGASMVVFSRLREAARDSWSTRLRGGCLFVVLVLAFLFCAAVIVPNAVWIGWQAELEEAREQGVLSAREALGLELVDPGAWGPPERQGPSVRWLRPDGLAQLTLVRDLGEPLPEVALDAVACTGVMDVAYQNVLAGHGVMATSPVSYEATGSGCRASAEVGGEAVAIPSRVSVEWRVCEDRHSVTAILVSGLDLVPTSEDFAWRCLEAPAALWQADPAAVTP